MNKDLTFEQVLEGLKKGNMYRRESWDEESAYIMINDLKAARSVIFVFPENFAFHPSQSDLFAKDWYELKD